MSLLWEVCNEFDISNDQPVLQQQVFEEVVFLQQRDGLGTEQADQQFSAGKTGGTGAVSWLLWKTQWLQYAVLT